MRGFVARARTLALVPLLLPLVLPGGPVRAATVTPQVQGTQEARGTPDPPAAAPRPNVVLLMADDQGWGDTSYNGHPRLRTPNLDAMAASGLCLQRFYSAAPVCSPTRASCLTGRHPARSGIPGANTGHLPADERHLGALLREQGYATGHFGKWHLGTLSRVEKDSNRGGRPQHLAHFAPPWERDFEVCFSTEAKVPTFDPMKVPGGEAAYGTAYWNQEGERVTEGLEGDDSRVIMDRVLPFVEHSVAAGRPFLAVVWFHAPHLPVVAGERHRAMYADVQDGARREYYACLSALDEQVGRLRDRLRALGVAEDTLVWYCSDNGPEGGSEAPGHTGGLRGRKRDLTEGGVRVPGLIEWPARLERTRTVTTPAWTCDILPTVLDALRLDPAEVLGELALDGQSLLPLIDGGELAVRRPLGFRDGGERAWHEGPWKLYRARKDAPWRLVRIEGDPGEREDLAAAQPEVVATLREHLEAWVQQTDEDAERLHPRDGSR